MLKWRVGDVSITQIVESTFDGGLEAFLPDATPEAVLPIDWLQPHFITPTGILKFSIHALVIETAGHRILVDTCVGNDKPRALFPQWDMQQYAFMQAFEAAGFRRESIDVVLCTHMHLDHVGWNTMRNGDRWEPTFPNARYLFGRDEFESLRRDMTSAELAAPLRDLNRAIYADSLEPVIAAGLAQFVATDHAVCAEVRLLPTPGHTAGHVSCPSGTMAAGAVPIQSTTPRDHRIGIGRRAVVTRIQGLGSISTVRVMPRICTGRVR